jgi:parallel beta-helix repeat protein
LHVDLSGNGDYRTIQEAIQEASPHDTIYVHPGIYYENIVINKTITLEGEEKGKTVIDGNGQNSVLNITADGVFLSRITIQNSGRGTDAGIKIDSAKQVTIADCELLSNYYGIWLYKSSNNTITHCALHDNFYGILFHLMSTSNTLSYSRIYNNDNEGIYLCCASNGNTIHHCDIQANEYYGIHVIVRGTTIYHNNFIDNGQNAQSLSNNYWDYEKQGNYWSDFDEPSEGAFDQDKDGIVDSPYDIPDENQDHYPFITKVEHNQENGSMPGLEFTGFLITILVIFISKKYF